MLISWKKDFIQKNPKRGKNCQGVEVTLFGENNRESCEVVVSKFLNLTGGICSFTL